MRVRERHKKRRGFALFFVLFVNDQSEKTFSASGTSTAISILKKGVRMKLEL